MDGWKLFLALKPICLSQAIISPPTCQAGEPAEDCEITRVQAHGHEV